AVPFALLDATVRSAMLVASGPLATAGVSMSVAALTKGVLQTMFLTRLTAVCGMVVSVSLLGTTTALFTYRTMAAGPGQAQTVARVEPPPRSVDEAKPDAQKQEAELSEEAASRQSLDRLKSLAL